MNERTTKTPTVATFVAKIIILFIILILSVQYSKAEIYTYVLPAGNVTEDQLKVELNKACLGDCINEDTIEIVLEDGVTTQVAPAGSDWNLVAYKAVVFKIMGSDDTGLGGGSFIVPKKSHVHFSDESYIVVDPLNKDALVAGHKSNSYINIGLASYHGSVFKMITDFAGAHSTGFGAQDPVELYYFDAKNKKGAIVVHWATESKEDSHHFEIEKSEDGLEFQTIATIQGEENEEDYVEYDYHDDESSTASLVYYRLAHVDYAGEKITLDVIDVKGK